MTINQFTPICCCFTPVEDVCEICGKVTYDIDQTYSHDQIIAGTAPPEIELWVDDKNYTEGYIVRTAAGGDAWWQATNFIPAGQDPPPLNPTWTGISELESIGICAQLAKNQHPTSGLVRTSSGMLRYWSADNSEYIPGQLAGFRNKPWTLLKDPDNVTIPEESFVQATVKIDELSQFDYAWEYPGPPAIPMDKGGRIYQIVLGNNKIGDDGSEFEQGILVSTWPIMHLGVKYNRWVLPYIAFPNWSFNPLTFTKPAEGTYYVTEWTGGSVTVSYCQSVHRVIWRIPEWGWAHEEKIRDAGISLGDYYRGGWEKFESYSLWVGPDGPFPKWTQPESTAELSIDETEVVRTIENPAGDNECPACEVIETLPPPANCEICRQFGTGACVWNEIEGDWDLTGNTFEPVGAANPATIVTDDDGFTTLQDRRFRFAFTYNENAGDTRWRAIVGYVDANNFVAVDFYFMDDHLFRVKPIQVVGGVTTDPIGGLQGAWQWIEGNGEYVDIYRQSDGTLTVLIDQLGVAMQWQTTTAIWAAGGEGVFGFQRVTGTSRVEFSEAFKEVLVSDPPTAANEGCADLSFGDRCEDIAVGDPLKCCSAFVPGQLSDIRVKLTGMCQEFNGDAWSEFRLLWMGDPGTGDDLCTWAGNFAQTIGGQPIRMELRMFSLPGQGNMVELDEAEFRIDQTDGAGNPQGGFQEWNSTHTSVPVLGPAGGKAYLENSTWIRGSGTLCGGGTLQIEYLKVPGTI